MPSGPTRRCNDCELGGWMPLVGFREGTRLLYSQGGTGHRFLPGMDLQGRRNVSMSHPMVQPVRVGRGADAPRPSGNPAVAIPERQQAVPTQSKNTSFLQELFIELGTRHRKILAQLQSVSLEGWPRQEKCPGRHFRPAHGRECRLERKTLETWRENRDRSRARSALSARASCESSGEG